jgi:hypothetical protein
MPSPGSHCAKSIFFQSEQAASTYLVDHPEAIFLSIEEAATVGKMVARSRFTKKNDEQE